MSRGDSTYDVESMPLSTGMIYTLYRPAGIESNSPASWLGTPHAGVSVTARVADAEVGRDNRIQAGAEE